MNEITKHKISETLKKKYKNGDLIPNMIGAHSLESRKKQSNSKKGCKLSEIHKSSISIGLNKSEKFLNSIKNKERINKIKKTKLERYNDENYCNSTKRNETNIKKFNSKCPLNNQEQKNKKIKTWLKKYGVDNPQKNQKIFLKTQSSGLKKKIFDDLIYQGSYEYDFLKNYYYRIKIISGLSISFYFDNKNRVYHSDFYIPELNLIIEVKSSYYFKKYINLNIAKKNVCINKGYNFIFIIDKNYEEFNKILNLK